VTKKYPLLRSTAPTTFNTYKNSGKALSATPQNLGNFYGPILDQGQEGSCTAFAGLQWRGALRKQAGLDWIDPSEQAQYYEERKIDGTVATDAGASMEDIVIVLEQFGVLPADKDPYTVSDMTTPPPVDGWRTDLKLSSNQVLAIDQGSILADTLDALSNGHPVLFGFEVFNTGWEDVSYNGTGILSMPEANEQSIGGHAVNAISYDPVKKLILVRNQYGADWGIKAPAEDIGCFWMPYDYYAQYAYNAFVGLPDSITPAPAPTPILKNLILYYGDADLQIAADLAQNFACPVIQAVYATSDLLASATTKYQVGGASAPEGVILLAGSDRFGTMKAVLQVAGKD